jgi:uncharacterized membrane protein YeaQ/YmgE (transglycosylase-associated protein family)
MGILSWILLGLVAGWLAGMLMRGGGYGILGDIILGIVGALVGGFVSSALFGIDVTGFNFTSVIVATLGAVIVIAIARALTPARHPTV